MTLKRELHQVVQLCVYTALGFKKTQAVLRYVEDI